jgi:muramoyltetrapeptide carboxypeptidase
MNLSKKIVRPPYLKTGDKVALVAPAYWVAEGAVIEAAEILKSWGLNPVIGEHTNSLNVDAYSGTADERAFDLLKAFEDEEIKAIFCSRGGYGSIHLLKRISKDSIQQRPKWLIGHGDITVLLNSIVASGVMCIYGPMAIQIAAKQEPSISIARNILFGTLPKYEISGNPYNRCGHAEGILVGGNLSSYSPIAGTDFHISSKRDIILFIEEVEEPLHAVDRLFYMLLLRLNFERVKGIIFGTFNSIRYDLQYGSVEQMLITHLHAHDISVCCGFPVGSNSCIPLIEGAPCTLDVTPDYALLTYNMEGDVTPYEVDMATPKLIKEKQL